MGLAQGANLGAAQGSITIDTTQAQQAVPTMQGVAQGITQAFAQIGAGASTAQTGLSGLASAARGIAGSLGIGLGAAGLAQLGKAAVAADEAATAYNRQSVAARNLAGSQDKLNELLVAYQEASGGAIDKAQALADVTRLQAVGMANSADELSRFVTAARGAAVAMGRSTQDILGEVQLATANQSFRRLDQIGLGVDEVHKKMDELKASTHGMSTEAAFQEAVISRLITKYGDLAKSAEGQKTSLEKLQANLKDYQLALDQVIKTPVDAASAALTAYLNLAQTEFGIATKAVNSYVDSLKNAMNIIGNFTGLPTPRFETQAMTRMSSGMASIDQGRHSRSSGGISDPTAEQTAAISDWAQKGREITKQTLQQINDEEAQYGKQRAETIANNDKAIARGAEDFARERAQAEQNLEESITAVREDGARRQLQQAAELARTIANAHRDSADRLADLQDDLDRTISERRADSADKIAGLEEDRDKSIADKKEESSKRLLEIEQNYNEQRVRSEAQYHLDRNEAAERLDGRALFDLDARHKLEAKQALDSKDKQISDEKSKLQETIDKVNESYAERISDEKKALDKSIKQANDAHNRQVDDEKEALQKRIDNANAAYGTQLADGIAADNQRITDLNTAYGKEKEAANAAYTLRLERQKQDNTDNLTAQDDAHKLRITQIGTHAEAERTALNDEFVKQMEQLAVHNAAWLAAQKTQQADALKLFDTFWKAFASRFGITLGPLEKPDTSFLDPRRQQLQGTIDEWKRQRGSTTDPAEIARLDGLISQMQTAIDALGPAGGTGIGASSFGMMSPSAFKTTPAMATASAMAGGSNRSLSVGDINVTVNAVSSDTASSIMDVIDKRILHQIQTAAGRL
jgi:hypothetical protein